MLSSSSAAALVVSVTLQAANEVMLMMTREAVVHARLGYIRSRHWWDLVGLVALAAIGYSLTRTVGIVCACIDRGMWIYLDPIGCAVVCRGLNDLLKRSVAGQTGFTRHHRS